MGLDKPILGPREGRRIEHNTRENQHLVPEQQGDLPFEHVHGLAGPEG